jgi:glycosyltransferase involved in cell wall biosynthesis
MTRIAMVAARYFPYLGGIEAHVHEVAPRLAADGFDVRILTCDLSGELPPVEVVQGIEVRRFHAGPANKDWILSPALYQELAKGGYDLVHVQGVHTGVPPAAMEAARRAGMPYVVTFHTGGYSKPLRNRLRGTQFRALAPLLRRADALIGVSDYEARRFRAYVGSGGPPVDVVRNGGSLPTPDPAVDVVPGRVLSVGRLEKYKGHHRLVAALPLLREWQPDAHVRILGDGPARQELMDLAFSLGVADRVTIDHVPPGDRLAMAREVAAAQVVGLLSDYEAHPVAVMEALTLHRPVLVARTSGLVELEVAGLVRGVPAECGPSVVAHSLDLQMRHPLHVDASTLPTWETCSAELASTYRKVLSRSPGPLVG